MIFHVDANSFYASCEGLFRPDLAGKPIAVLSNNDGIIIALNQECKAMGFHRGDAYFEVKDELTKKNVSVFSSNYTLYANISARLNLVYARLSPETEIYSIDETFLFFPDWRVSALVDVGNVIRETIRREVGIPVSVGIAPTKTLAKLCNKLAKKRGGVCCWGELDQDAELAQYPAGDVWGIGAAKRDLLERHGVHTAFDLKNYPLHQARKHLTLTGYSTVQELNGISVIERIERDRRKNICSSKSFAEPVYALEGLQVALAEYTQEAVKRMREEKSACRYVSVYLMTNPFSDVGSQYFNSLSAELPYRSSYYPDILKVASDLLAKMYRSGFRYRKVMVNLLDLEDDTLTQLDLFDQSGEKTKHDALMIACDKVNEKYGRGTLHIGVADQKFQTTAWRMKRNFLSPAYTSDLREVPAVK